MTLHVGSRGENRDAAKRVECQEIAVARHDHIGAPIHRDVEELVILRIARRVKGLYDGHDFDEGRQAQE